ncbi:hypothetical protein [Microvirga sp. G4-2]|uniref:hypothetical protein n=1 Tax=Microvirga sp. G4-2 TaxID=3434467 RepID=UPI004043FF83
MLQPDPAHIIEETRLDRLRGLHQSIRVEQLPDASHAAAVLMKAIDDNLAGHPHITADPELYHLAYRAFEALFTLHHALTREQKGWA